MVEETQCSFYTDFTKFILLQMDFPNRSTIDVDLFGCMINHPKCESKPKKTRHLSSGIEIMSAVQTVCSTEK